MSYSYVGGVTKSKNFNIIRISGRICLPAERFTLPFRSAAKNRIDRKGKANDPLAIHPTTSFRRFYEAISDMDCSLLKRAVSRACDRVYHNQTKRTPDGRTACFHTDHSCFLSAAEAEALQTPGKIGAYL